MHGNFEAINPFVPPLGTLLTTMVLTWLQVARTEWVLKWPGQLVIAGCQTYWTAEVSEALEQQDLEGYVPKLLSQVSC